MDKEWCLRSACHNGRLEEAMGLIDEGVDVESRNWNWNDRATPLIMAACNDKVDIIRLLLDHGANVHSKDSDGDTALHCAAYNGYDEAVKLLIGGGANLHVKNNDNRTPLDEAKRHDRSSTIAIIEATIKSTKGKNE